jgi:uncharacterized membrane protein YhaH (DUF805 family)
MAFSFDINRLTRQERVIGIATFVLLVAIFLPWVSGNETETLNGKVVSSAHYGSISGYTLHGYFWIVFILCLAVIAFLVAKAGLQKMPFAMPVTDDQALLGATGLSFIIVLLGFLFNSYAYSSTSVTIAGYSDRFSTSYDFGAYLSLIAAVVAVAPLAWPIIQQQRQKRSA